MIAGLLACLFVGDSTAQGAAQALNRSAPIACAIVARVGAGSAEVARWTMPPTPARFAIVGIGTNDPANPSLQRNLWAARRKIYAARVVWLLPYHRGAAAQVEAVATTCGDYVLDLAVLPTRDRIHPASYAGVATALRRLGVQ